MKVSKNMVEIKEDIKMEKCPCCKKSFHLPKWWSTSLPYKYRYSLEEKTKRYNQFCKLWLEGWSLQINKH